jgi:hypothetical protein
MQNFNKILAGIILLISLVSCSHATGNVETSDGDSFEIHIGEWNKPVTEANLGYTVESSWSLLIEWYLTDSTFVIDTSDVDNYDWEQHVITLTPEASANFYSAFELAKYPLAFVVTVNDKPMYGGIFLFRQSAMGILFPVIYEDYTDGKVTFTIRPRHDIFDNYQPADDWHGINNPVIKDVLVKAGKIK